MKICFNSIYRNSRDHQTEEKILPATQRLRERPPEKINTRNLRGGGGVRVERKRDNEKRETDVY